MHKGGKKNHGENTKPYCAIYTKGAIFDREDSMRYLARVNEKEIKAILAKALSVDEGKIDMYVDADNQIVAEAEMGELDIKKEMKK